MHVPLTRARRVRSDLPLNGPFRPRLS